MPHPHRAANLPTDTRGIKNGRCKLTETQVLDIFSIYETRGHSQRQLAALYDVSQSLIHRIVTKVAWKHLWPPPALVGA